MKHVKPSTRSMLAKANLEIVEVIPIDPCLGRTGWDLYKCRKQNPT